MCYLRSWILSLMTFLWMASILSTCPWFYSNPLRSSYSTSNMQFSVLPTLTPIVNFVMGWFDFGHCRKTLVLIDFLVEKFQSWVLATLQNLQFLGIHFYASSWKYHINFALMNFLPKFFSFLSTKHDVFHFVQITFFLLLGFGLWFRNSTSSPNDS